MGKTYSDRQMKKDDGAADDPAMQDFFFPKNNPPVTIKARTREEAEAKAKELDNKKNV